MVRLNQLLWSGQYVTQRIPGDRTRAQRHLGATAVVVRLHTFTTLSSPAVASHFPSELSATAHTSSEWPESSCCSAPSLTRQSRAVLPFPPSNRLPKNCCHSVARFPRARPPLASHCPSSTECHRVDVVGSGKGSQLLAVAHPPQPDQLVVPGAREYLAVGTEIDVDDGFPAPDKSPHQRSGVGAPKLDRLVEAAASNELAVGAEGDAPHVERVSLESVQQCSIARTPKPDRLVFATGRDALSVRAVRDEPDGPRMSLECASERAIPDSPQPRRSVIASAHEPLPVRAERDRRHRFRMPDHPRELAIRHSPYPDRGIDAAGGEELSVRTECDLPQYFRMVGDRVAEARVESLRLCGCREWKRKTKRAQTAAKQPIVSVNCGHEPFTSGCRSGFHGCGFLREQIKKDRELASMAKD